jgi:N-terminal domain of anti-restriction factor ArdC
MNTTKTIATIDSKKPNTKQELIATNIKLLIEQLEAGHSEALTNYLTAMSRFRTYSFGNVLEIARQMPEATRVAGFWTWKNLGRSVKAGQKGIRILAPIVGVRRKKDAEANKDITTQNERVLLGFRNAYVFDRLSRDLRPAWPATVLRRRVRMSCVRLDGSSHIIAQFAGSLQGSLDTDEFQFAGGDLSGGFVVSLCCV